MSSLEAASGNDESTFEGATSGVATDVGVETYDPAVLAELCEKHPEVAAVVEQLRAANSILRSEAMMWLVVGSNHEQAQLADVTKGASRYFEKYGSWATLTAQDRRGLEYKILRSHQERHPSLDPSSVSRQLCRYCQAEAG